ncbi:MAG: hypothetical protein AB1457_11765, partial [Chloroflexota bacterium]
MLDMTLTGLRHREGVGEVVGEMSRFARHDINRFTSPRVSAASVAVSRKIVGKAVGEMSRFAR